MTKKPNLELDQAKHVIDLLTMLEQKTEGNRSPEETAELDSTLHELRLAYVTISDEARTKTLNSWDVGYASAGHSGGTACYAEA